MLGCSLLWRLLPVWWGMKLETSNCAEKLNGLYDVKIYEKCLANWRGKMAGRRSKRKGSSAEREFAKLIGGHRIPLSGSVSGFKGDVKGLGLTWEVKRRREAFSRIYGWLEGEG